MTIDWDQIIGLLPILIIGTTIVVIILSVSYRRNQFKHALLTITGLVLAAFVSISIIWKKLGIQNTNQFIYIDNSAVLYVILIILASLASSISVYTWLLCYPTSRREEFYLLLLISSMGGILLTTANHLATLFLGIELISIPLFGLIGYSFFQKNSIEASIKYVVLSGISSSFFLFGMAFLYAETGCLSFSGIKEIFLTYYYNNSDIMSFQSVLLTVMGFTMMMVGFSFKLSVVPFHLWTPDVYQGAPSSVSMYLATTSKIAIASVLIRFLLILPEQYYQIFYIFLSGLACSSMLFGSLMAIQENSIKRILAYSSVTHSGYLLVFLITTSHLNYCIAQEAIIIYLTSYLFATVGAFGVINILSFSYVKKNIDTLCLYRGLFWREPGLSIIFTVIILSLAGIPMTLGFIGKFYLLLIGINNQLWWIIIFVVITSIISMFYYLKIIINLYLYPVDHEYLNKNILSHWVNSALGVMIIIIAIIILVFGVYPHPIIHLIHLICMS